MTSNTDGINGVYEDAKNAFLDLYINVDDFDNFEYKTRELYFTKDYKAARAKDVERIKKLENDYETLKAFCFDYQLLMGDLMRDQGKMMTFQDMRKQAYSYRVARGEKPIWGAESYMAEVFPNLIHSQEKISQLEADKARDQELRKVDLNLIIECQKQTKELESKLKEIELYCIKNKEYMWAAKIWSIITEKDFRDISTQKINNEKTKEL